MSQVKVLKSYNASLDVCGPISTGVFVLCKPAMMSTHIQNRRMLRLFISYVQIEPPEDGHPYIRLTSYTNKLVPALK